MKIFRHNYQFNATAGYNTIIAFVNIFLLSNNSGLNKKVNGT